MPPVPTPVSGALARSEAYKLFALLFTYPSEDLFEAYRTGDFLDTLGESLAAVPHSASALGPEDDLRNRSLTELHNLSLIDLEVAFNQLFEVGAPEPPCPPNEGLHRKGVERTSIMIEVAEFYKRFGLGLNREEGRAELPDHLRAELEFLHYLCFKEAQARQEGAVELLKGYVHAQRDFLERHLVPWVPEFAAKVEAASSLALYGGTAGLLSRFVAADAAYVRELFGELGPAAPQEDAEATGALVAGTTLP